MTDTKLENSENGQKTSEEAGLLRLEPKVEAYLQELLKEKHILSTSAYPHASRLMQEEVQRTQQSGRMPKDTRYADVYKERPIKVTVKVAVPIREHPKFNFVGKLLGPKGNSLKRLQEETMCKMSILGRGSMKDKVKEEELRKGLDPKFSHLSDDLHIEISALAPPAEAHARIAYALAEIRKFLIPDSNDDISMEQLREMENYMEPPPGGVEEEPPQKRPMVRPVRGMFRGGPSNRGGIMRGQAGTFSSRPVKSEEQYYHNSFSRFVFHKTEK
ncbi:hypothetical protein RUM44_005432 [Polyplax serrata]|uniref:K Homology domain-containing protein n=1 Tax=Polyplax serrata TaxID=468196 RepID=A0ABR1AWF9_POLSC